MLAGILIVGSTMDEREGLVLGSPALEHSVWLYIPR